MHALAHIHLWVCISWPEKVYALAIEYWITAYLYVLYACGCTYTSLSRVLPIFKSNSSPLTALCDLNLSSHLFSCYSITSTHVCTFAQMPVFRVCVYVCVCVATVTVVIDRSPCRVFCHVEKGNADSERDSEEDWRGNLHGDNYAVLHLLHLTSTRCRSKSFLALNRKYFLRSNDG